MKRFSCRNRPSYYPLEELAVVDLEMDVLHWYRLADHALQAARNWEHLYYPIY